MMLRVRKRFPESFLRMYKQWIPGHFSLLPRDLGMRLIRTCMYRSCLGMSTVTSNVTLVNIGRLRYIQSCMCDSEASWSGRMALFSDVSLDDSAGVLCGLDNWEHWMWRSQVLNEADALVCQNGVSSGSGVLVVMLHCSRERWSWTHQQHAN